MKFEYITKVPYSLSIACCKIRHACNLKWHITLADNTQYLWAELWYKRVLIGQRSSREAVCKSTWQRKTLYHRTPLVMGSAHVNWKRGSVWAVLAMIHGIGYMNYIETCTKIAVFLWRSSNYRPLKSVLHVRPGWIIYQNMRETWEKKVMKFEHEIPIGLDAWQKNRQGGP